MNRLFSFSGRTFLRQNGNLQVLLKTELGVDNNRSHKLQITLPNQQKVLFSLKDSSTVKEFLENLKEEDSTIASAAIHTADGAKISGSTSLSDFIGSSFQIVVNGKKITVEPTTAKSNSKSFAPATPVDEFERLKKEIFPLYLEKRQIDKKSVRYANAVVWGGLGYLVAQWAFLARLTWWDFNWDIMEPVTYFITFGTAIVGYVYFAITKREYTFPDLRDSIAFKRMYNQYSRNKFDLEKYYKLEYQLKQYDPDAVEHLEDEAEHISRQAATEEKKEEK